MENSVPNPPRTRLWKRAAVCFFAAVLLYLLFAYAFMPLLWERYYDRHPALDDLPGITETKNGIPGDPINVALVGTEEEVMTIMVAAKWYPADPLTLRSCLKIAAASVLKRPYDEAPVSNLYFWGRKEDLAFEQAVDDDPRKRHHVRFWQSEKVDAYGRPLWAGSAIFDARVGLSRKTGQVTHFIAPDIDTERDYLFSDLEHTGDLAAQYILDGFHKTLSGKNGGGHPWHTDGRLFVGVIALKK